MVKVSVIVPVYNVGPYLREALESLVNQSLQDIEIIAVNDGSTDNSEDILKEYQKRDRRVRYVNQENQGQSGARNTGMALCSGEYLYFMDSDDVVDTRALEICYATARQHDADVCLFDADVFYERGARPLPWDYDRAGILHEGRRYGGEELMNLLMDTEKHSAVVWLQFIKADYLKRLRLDFYRGIIHEDELFTVRLLLPTDSIFYIARRFVRHRVRPSSTVGKGYSQRNLNCYMTVFDELFKFQDSPFTRKFARYTLEKVFYTGHLIPLREKPAVFWRALRSGYLKYIGLRSALAFWLKRKLV